MLILNNLFQSLENFDELRTARTPWYSSPSLGVLPSPTNLSCELRVSKPDYTSNIGRASQLDGIIEGTSSFWDRFRYISIIASTVNNKNYSLIKTNTQTIKIIVDFIFQLKTWNQIPQIWFSPHDIIPLAEELRYNTLTVSNSYVLKTMIF